MVNVLEWLRQGRDDAEDLVDLPWDVKELGENHYVASHPKVLFDVHVILDDFVHLAVPTGIETVAMRLEEKVRTFHILLILNERLNLLKFTLSGMSDEITIRVDLDPKALSKEEFNDALTALLVGMNILVQELGLEEEFQRSIAERLTLMILERLDRGASRAEILDFLVRKVGLPRKDAENLMKAVLENSAEDRGYF